MTIYRGSGGGGNATTDSEIALLTQLEQSSSSSAASAAASAAAALVSENNAETAETNAAASEAAAAASASAASTSATNAASSASSASASATNAANSASAAATSESNAASSASAAATSASNAATSETNAASSASAASTSATNAANSASAASTSATNAANSASAASTSETNAASSASAASTSASNAATSESNAAASAAAAATFDPANFVEIAGDTMTGNLTVPSLTDSGNLTFTGTGNRITGDFSNATIANRVMFQTSTANSVTVVSAIPSGTGTQANFNLHNNSDPTNASDLRLLVNASEARIQTNITGTGSYLPMTFYTGGAERMRIGTSGNVQFHSTGSAISNVASINGGQLAGMRNKIINGKMEIAQRGTSASGGGYATVDRWAYQAAATTAVITQSQQTDAPSDNEFQNSFRIAVTTADASIATGDLAYVTQIIEGFNVRDLLGRSFTLSFRVRSSKTGVHCVRFGNSGQDRSYVAEYTINTANTWETKSITVSGGLITAGTWNWTNGAGLRVVWTLAAGSTWQTTAGAWQTGELVATANQVNCLDTIGNIFAITGVQLEVGSVATPFEHRPYGIEEMLCKRYTRVTASGASFGGRANGTAAVRATIGGSVPMRATPTASDVAANAFGPTQVSTKAGGSVSVIANTDAGVVVDVNGFAGLTDNRSTTLELTGALTLSAEL